MPEQPEIEKVVQEQGLEQKSLAETVQTIGVAAGGVGGLMAGGAALVNAVRPNRPSEPQQPTQQPPADK